MASWTIDRDNAEAFLKGMSTFGTGGGGSPEAGRGLIYSGLEAGRSFEFIDPYDVPDDAHVCSGGIMGSVRKLQDDSDDKTADPEAPAKMLVNAIRTMEEVKGVKVDYIIPFEVGCLNTPVIMSAASMLGIPVIDGDGAGRAAPETQMTSWIGKGISLVPMPVCTGKGEAVVVLRDGGDVTYADKIGREVVMQGGGSAANAHYFMTGKEMKECSCLHILSKALELGKIQQAAEESGINQTDAVRAYLGAKTFIKGCVESEKGVDAGGFYSTELSVKGTDEYAGHSAKLILKNETMLIWVDDVLRCIFPDYIFMIDPATGMGIQTADLKVGMEIEFMGAPCHERTAQALDTPEGKDAFACERYGYPELEYTSFEVLNR